MDTVTEEFSAIQAILREHSAVEESTMPMVEYGNKTCVNLYCKLPGGEQRHSFYIPRRDSKWSVSGVPALVLFLMICVGVSKVVDDLVKVSTQLFQSGPI